MSETSRMAYEAVKKDLSELQFFVLGAAKRRGSFIDEEIERDLGGRMTPQSVRSRRAELVQLGRIEKTTEKRRNSRGGLCAVWAVKKEPQAGCDGHGQFFLFADESESNQGNWDH